MSRARAAARWLAELNAAVCVLLPLGLGLVLPVAVIWHGNQEQTGEYYSLGDPYNAWRSGEEPAAEVTDAPQVDPVAGALAEAAAVEQATAGRTCWDPVTGQVGTHLVVRWADDNRVELIPFTAETYDQAVAGAFWTLRACS